MANQPTKYKKFVATAATATLVASAIVPVASAATPEFSDITGYSADVQAAINALAAQGIINGTSATTFEPGKEITRGQVVKLLGKWVESKGAVAPTNWKTVERFTDLPVDSADQELLKYAAIAYDAGVFQGSNGVLNSSGKISRENMALVLDRAYDKVFGTSLVELAADVTNVNVADLATAKAEAQPAIQALKDLEISVSANFNPKGNVTRANFATFLQRALNVKAEATVTAVSAINATNLDVTVTGSVKDLTIDRNDFTVKVGENKVEVTNVKVVDGKYRLTLASALKENDVVVVTGANDLVGNASVTYKTTAISSVAGVVAVVDSTKTGQRLAFKVNGADATVESLVAEGYDVQFQASESVFAGATATVSGNGILDQATLATLLATKTSFKYKVVVSKSGVTVAQSEQVTVQVFDGTKTATAIKEFNLVNAAAGTFATADAAPKLTSKKLVKGSADIAVLQSVTAGQLMDNRLDIDVAKTITVESSNPFVVAASNPTGTAYATLAPVGLGTATITVKSGNAVQTFTIEVVSEARKVASVTTSDSSLKLARGGVKDVTLTFKDQYGDVLQGLVPVTDYDIPTVLKNSNNEQIATVSVPAATDKKGQTTAKVTADATFNGAGTLRISKPSNGSDIISVPVTVEADSIVKTVKLEAANSASNDYTIDLNDEKIDDAAGDHEVILNLNGYTNAGSFIGAQTTVTSLVAPTVGNYNVTLTNPKGAVVTGAAAGNPLTVAVLAGVVTIAPSAAATRDYTLVGTYYAKVYDENNTLVYTQAITVKDSAPVVSAANFVTGYEIHAANPSTGTLLPVDNVKITGAGGDGKVRVTNDAAATLWIDADGSGTYAAAKDITLGKLVGIYTTTAGVSSPVVFATDATVGATAPTATIAAASEGKLILGVQKRGADTPAFTSTFTVKN